MNRATETVADPRHAARLPIDTVAAVCAALADPTRLRILALLLHGEVCVCDIHGSLAVPQPTASRHLAYLRRHALVVGRKEGLWVHYRLGDDLSPPVRRLIEAAIHAATHTPEAAHDGRQLARATGRRIALTPTATRGCCRP